MTFSRPGARRFGVAVFSLFLSTSLGCSSDDTSAGGTGTGGGGAGGSAGAGGVPTGAAGGGADLRDAGSDGESDSDTPMPVTLTLQNQGTSVMEGHTPRGFQGMGTGLFAGDNLNPNFPEGDGVQIFLSFDLSQVPAGTIQSAVLRSVHGSTSGTPFVDLGSLYAEEVRYLAFSSALWDLQPEPDAASCVFGVSAAGPFECDLGSAVQRSLDESYEYAQFRLRFETAGDSDGSQDLARFFITDSNTNEPGIFELEVTVSPAGE